MIKRLFVATAIFALPSVSVASCLNEVKDFAIEICGAIADSGSAQKLSASGELSAEAQGIIRRILGSAGGNVDTEYLNESWSGVLQNELSEDRFDTRQCRREMVQIAREEACVSVNTCRRPEFGLERYGNVQQFSGGSGWKDGGYSQPAYCSDLERATISSLGLRGGSYSSRVVASGERGRWVVRGLNPRHRQYHYQCTIEISWNPIYRARQDVVCGTSRGTRTGSEFSIETDS